MSYGENSRGIGRSNALKFMVTGLKIRMPVADRHGKRENGRGKVLSFNFEL